MATENPSSAAPAAASVDQKTQGVALLLRALGCLFSLLSLAIMASIFSVWEVGNLKEFSYLLAIGVLAFLYTLVQVVVGAIIFVGKVKGPFCLGRIAAILNFTGDQVFAYLLLSALSAAIPITNRMDELTGVDSSAKEFVSKAAASVSMAFFAFVALSLSAMLSAYRLFTQT